MIPLHHSVEFQHHLWDDILSSAKYIVDITCGNGHDTEYLLSRSHEESQLYTIDIQEIAIHRTRERLEETCPTQLHRVHFLTGSHDVQLAGLPIPHIDLMVANLGYLPNANHQTMTSADTTIQALTIGLEKLSLLGLCTVVAYPGTDEGREEQYAVQQFLESLDQRYYHCSTWHPINQANHPPILYIIRRRK